MSIVNFGIGSKSAGTNFPMGRDGLQGVPQLGQDGSHQAQLLVVQLTRDGYRQGVHRGGQGQGVAVRVSHIITHSSL